MICFPNAKINLGLHITSKRKDGFHDIETCMVPIPLCDALEMIIDQKTTWNVTGLEIPGGAKDNLVLKALNLLKRDFNNLPHVNIHLHKNIPMGGGLGGGSSDAGFALKLMNSLFDLHLENWFLEEYAVQLGSDCPFFVENTPKIATGRGEILEQFPIDLSNKFLVLVKPPEHISTQDAYAKILPQKPQGELRSILSDQSLWKDHLVNVFEKSIFSRHPNIARIKTDLYDMGAFYAAMSGSGSTVFGLFEQKPEKKDWDKDFFVFETEM